MVNNKKWTIKRIDVSLGTQELEKLEKYCQETGRSGSDVIRELIRTLPH